MKPDERLETLNAEIDRRIDLIARIERGGPEGVATALAYYADHVAEWMDSFLWGFDPRNADIKASSGEALPVYVPMVTCTVQSEFVAWMQWLRAEQKHGYAPKSRGVGLSYYVQAYHLHRWLFEPAYKGSSLSNTEEGVDRRADPDSLFEKTRIMLEFLPAWMRPDGFVLGVTSEHDNHRRLINPETAAVLVGKIGKNPGRGGRSSFSFVDESAHVDDLEKVRRAIRDNSDSSLEGSTYNGTGEPFWRSASKLGKLVFKITWEDIPWYDDEWYARAEEKYADDPAGFAQEILADPTASVPDLVIPAAWVRACVNFEGWYLLQRKQSPKMLGTKAAGLDIAGYGSNLTVLLCRSGAVVDQVFETTEGNTTHNAYWASAEAARYGCSRVAYDDIGIGQGVGDTWASTEPKPVFSVLPFSAGDSPTEYRWPNGLTSKDRFVNLRCEMWWHVRERCRKTFEVRQGIRAWPLTDCLSLPPHRELCEQLSQPKEIRDRRKIMVESKKDMAARGIRSPDYADALIMSEYALMAATVTKTKGSALDRVRAMHGNRGVG